MGLPFPRSTGDRRRKGGAIPTCSHQMAAQNSQLGRDLTCRMCPPRCCSKTSETRATGPRRPGAADRGNRRVRASRWGSPCPGQPSGAQAVLNLAATMENQFTGWLFSTGQRHRRCVTHPAKRGFVHTLTLLHTKSGLLQHSAGDTEVTRTSKPLLGPEARSNEEQVKVKVGLCGEGLRQENQQLNARLA